MDASSYNESAASAVALMAFVAHEGARQADGAYSVYTLKPVTKETDGANPNPNPEPQSDAKPLAQTGDDSAAAAAAAIVLCALASGAVAVRRARRSRTLA